jgi:hypothetical protein
VGLKLCKLIDPENKLDVGSGPRHPLVILAFDESHILTDLLKDRDWTLFSELCRTLRGIVNQPIFSVFLLTVVTIHRNHAYQKLFPFIITRPNSLLSLLSPCINDQYVIKLPTSDSFPHP